MPSPATCYKFIVANAHEAASVIRDRLGENARVLSVRSIEPTGLRSLWASPKIEVIAAVAPAVSPVGVELAPPSERGASRTEQARPLRITSSDEASPNSGPGAPTQREGMRG